MAQLPMKTMEQRLAEKKVSLPPFNAARANYSPAVRTGSLIFTAGQTTRYGGAMQFVGQMTADRLEEGYQGARLCALNCLAILDALAGGLDNVARIVKVTGFVNAPPTFTQQAQVLDGATDLLVELFGDLGRPARSAVGVSSLPGNSICEVEMIVEVKDCALCRI